MTTPALVSATEFPTYGTDSGSGVGPSFGQSTTAGNFLVAFATSNDGGSSYPITASSGWTLAVSGGQAYGWAGIYYKADCGSGETPPDFFDSGAPIIATAAAEFSGVATSSPLDQTGASVGDPVTASAVDSAGGDLILALIAWNGSNTNPTVGLTLVGSDALENAATALGSSNGNGRDAEPYWIFGYKVGPATLGSHANKAIASSSEYENVPTELIVSFKAA